MEPILLLIPIVGLAVLAGAICGFIALVRQRSSDERIERLTNEVQTLRERMQRNQTQTRMSEMQTATTSPMPPSSATAAPETPVHSPSPATPPTPSVIPPRSYPYAEPVEVQKLRPETTTAVVPQPVRETPFVPVITSRPEEPRLDMERMVGQRWLTWAGVAVLFLAAVFFLKYAWDQGWLADLIGPRVRIALIAAAGIAAVITGVRLMGQGMAAIGQGLAGGGCALGYLAVYGGFAPHLGIVPEPLLSPIMAFALMATVSLGGIALAVRAHALSLAVIATIGGLVTPVLISTGHPNRDLLASYLLVLDAAVLAAAAWRSWRWLDQIAFVGTMLLLGAATGVVAHPNPDLPMLRWLAVFHAVFLGTAFILHWRTRTPVPAERFALALANIAICLGWVATILHEDAPLALGLTTCVLAVIYAALGWMTRSRIPEDRRVGEGFDVLAIVLIMLALFWSLPVEAVAVSWAVEACALVWIGYRFERRMLRDIASCIMAVAVARCLLVHLPDAPSAAPLVFHRWFFELAVVPAGCAMIAWVHRHGGAVGNEVGIARWWSALGAVAMLVLGSVDMMRHADGHRSAWVDVPLGAVIALWWSVGVATALAWHHRCPSHQAIAVWGGGLLVALIASIVPFASQDGIGELMFLDVRCLAALALLVVVARATVHQPHIGWVAFGYGVLILSLEPSQWCHEHLEPSIARVSAHFAVTLAWIIAAISLLVVGFIRRQRTWRFAALALLGLTAVKLLFVDMADARQLTRIASFAAVGVVLMLSAYAYHRLEQRIGK